MDVCELVKNKSFGDAAVLVTAAPYHLLVKENDNLYMLLFTSKSDMSLPAVRQASGIILEKETNNIVHYTFSLAYDGINGKNKNTLVVDMDKEEYIIEQFTEGSLIRVYFYNNEWNIGTSKTINAAMSFWGSTKSFKELFYECIDACNFDMNSLDSNNCYTFIMQHPEIKSGGNTVSQMSIIMVNMVNTKTCTEIRTTDYLMVDTKFNDLSKDSNYMVFFGDGRRSKIMCSNFFKNQKLLRNSPSIKASYIESVKNQTYKEFIASFPNENDTFSEVDALLNIAIDAIYLEYLSKFVFKKQEFTVNFKYEKSLRQLHYIYRKSRNPITKNDVEDLLFGLTARTILWIIDA